LDARECDFASVVFRRRYFVQSSFYLDLWNELNPDDQRTHFVFVAVEKFAPYAIQIHDLDPGDIQEGRWEYRHNLATLIECLKAESWPSYQGGVHKLKMRVPYNKGRTVLQE
jgi:exodeoxyribonuclease VIII